MSLIVWILLGFVVGLAASKTVSTTGEGAVFGGWIFDRLGGDGVGGFDLGSVYSAGVATAGAIVVVVLYHVFLRRRML